MKTANIRIITALAAVVLITIGFVTNIGIGTVSAIGWLDISILCPLGALSTMLASKMLVPRALIALIIVVVLIVLVGKAFCAWICPVPLLQRIRGFLSKNPAKQTASLSASETKALKSSSCSTAECSTTDCSSCAEKRGTIDSRHFILGGSLLSAVIFGFPVFCLVCPIGLTFASILLVIRLFGGGDMTWSIIVVPLLLAVEVIFFRKWCSKLCPLSAFMSILGKLNRTFRPSINDKTCLETAQGTDCGLCGQVCPEGIDPRHPERSASSMCECSKCRECVEVCPTKALKMPLLPVARSKVTAPPGKDGGERQELNT